MKKSSINALLSVYAVEGYTVTVKRVNNSSSGCPRFECTVLSGSIGYQFIINTYEGEKAAAHAAVYKRADYLQSR